MKNKTIKALIIEDNPAHSRLTQEYLSESRDVPFKSEIAERLSIGIEQVSKGDFDIVLLDLGLPDSQGLDTFVKVHSQAQQIPIIVMSSLDDEAIAAKAVHEGAQDYLVKGQIDNNLLVRSIRYAIERKRTEGQIKASLREKELLLKEIHHRVKNNLQVISSLLNLQSRYVKDENTLSILKECQNRIKSMALIHEKLYQSKDIARIDFSDYIKTLTVDLFRSYKADPAAIKLKMNGGDVKLGIDTAIPCGLILNELVLNCLKHAFPEGKKGEICIDFHSGEENICTMIVGDNGIGFPENLDFRNTGSLGLQLVNTLVDQLRGTIELDRSGGTAFKIEFGEKMVRSKLNGR